MQERHWTSLMFQPLSCHLHPSQNSINTTCRVAAETQSLEWYSIGISDEEIRIDYEAFPPVWRQTRAEGSRRLVPR